MNTYERILLDRVIEKIEVSDHKVALAKGFILNYNSSVIKASSIVEEFIGQQGYGRLKPLIDDGGGTGIENQIKDIGSYFSFYIAFSEAIWGLINDGEFLADNNRMYYSNFKIEYSEFSAGVTRKAAIRLDNYDVFYPEMLNRPLSKRNSNKFKFSNPDYYILTYGLTEAHEEIIESIKDGLNCFNKQLYKPATIMLGQAVEGAWIELGIALSNHLPNEKETLVEKFKGPDSLVWKINKAYDLYASNQNVFKQMKIESSVSPNELQAIRSWTDVIRDSRNAIHFGVPSVVENTYEKTSILYITAAQYLQMIYKLKKACDKLIS